MGDNGWQYLTTRIWIIFFQSFGSFFLNIWISFFGSFDIWWPCGSCNSTNVSCELMNFDDLRLVIDELSIIIGWCFQPCWSIKYDRMTYISSSLIPWVIRIYLSVTMIWMSLMNPSKWRFIVLWSRNYSSKFSLWTSRYSDKFHHSRGANSSESREDAESKLGR